MSLFRKKRRMIDVRELQKQGKFIPREDSPDVETDNEGFVEMTSSRLPLKANSQTIQPTPPETKKQSTSFFGFMDNPTPESISTEISQDQKDETIKKLSQQITQLDNTIYKLEQRIELLERKAGVNNDNYSSTNTSSDNSSNAGMFGSMW